LDGVITTSPQYSIKGITTCPIANFIKSSPHHHYFLINNVININNAQFQVQHLYYGQAIMSIGKFAILHAILVVRIVLCSNVTTYAKIRKVEKGKKIVV
jgi:hypothetical protein